MNLFRFLCALLVLISHLRVFPNTGLESEKFSVGAIGVDFFFILSGFSMAGMIEKYKDTQKFALIFLINRFIRVAIPYLVATLLFIIIIDHNYQMEEIYKSIFFMNNYNNEFKIFGLPILPPGWSINYEMIFYYSLVLALVTKNIKYFPIFLILLVCTTIFVPLSYIWLELIAGFFIYNNIIINKIISKNQYLFIFFSLICIVIIFINREVAGDFISSKRIFYWGIPAAIVFSLVQYYISNLKDSYFSEKGVILNMSFSIYLTHWIVLKFNSQTNNQSVFILYCELFLVSVIYYLLVEFPCHKISKALFLKSSNPINFSK